MAPLVYWMRNDLRIRDNYALNRAMELADSPNSSSEHDEFAWTVGQNRMGIYQTRFLIESLQNLRERLQSRGSDLLVIQGETEKVLSEVVSLLSASTLVFQSQTSYLDRKAEEKVQAALATVSCKSEAVWGNTLFHLDDAPFGRDLQGLGGRGSFGVLMQRSTPVRQLLPAPSAGQLAPFGLDGLEQALTAKGFSCGIPPVSSLLSLPASVIDAEPDPLAVMEFKGGEAEGLARLAQYVWEGDCLEEYFEMRNGFLGRDFSSKLSPWMSLGCLSPRWVFWEVVRWEMGGGSWEEEEEEEEESLELWLRRSDVDGHRSRHEFTPMAQRGPETRGGEEGKGTAWMMFELESRDYTHLLALQDDGATKLPEDACEQDAETMRRFAAWKDGTTGQPLVDAAMTELARTGYLSNRGRLICASYLCLDLRVPYWMGAFYFESVCIDHDASINWGYWKGAARSLGHWAVEAQTFGGVRGANGSDLLRQCVLYDEDGAYIRTWLPELAAIPAPHCFAPWRLSAAEQDAMKMAPASLYCTPPDGEEPAAEGGGRAGEAAAAAEEEEEVRVFHGFAADRVKVLGGGRTIHFLDFEQSRVGPAFAVGGGAAGAGGPAKLRVRVVKVPGEVAGGSMCLGAVPKHDTLPLDFARSAGFGWLPNGDICCPRLQAASVEVQGRGVLQREGLWGFRVPEATYAAEDLIGLQVTWEGGEGGKMRVDLEKGEKLIGVTLSFLRRDGDWYFAISGESDSATLSALAL